MDTKALEKDLRTIKMIGVLLQNPRIAANQLKSKYGFNSPISNWEEYKRIRTMITESYRDIYESLFKDALRSKYITPNFEDGERKPDIALHSLIESYISKISKAVKNNPTETPSIEIPTNDIPKGKEPPRPISKDTKENVNALCPEYLNRFKCKIGPIVPVEALPENVNGYSDDVKKEYKKIARYYNDYANQMTSTCYRIAWMMYQKDIGEKYDCVWTKDYSSREWMLVHKYVEREAFSFKSEAEAYKDTIINYEYLVRNYTDAYKKWLKYDTLYKQLDLSTGNIVIKEVPALRKIVQEWADDCMNFIIKKWKDYLEAKTTFQMSCAYIKGAHEDKQIDWREYYNKISELEKDFNRKWKNYKAFDKKGTLDKSKLKSYWDQAAKNEYDFLISEAQDRVGEIYDCEEYMGAGSANALGGGWDLVFTGSKGKIHCYLIFAGGYHIQTEHIRCLWKNAK